MKYTFSSSDPASGYIDIEIVLECRTGELVMQLPCWRPGRYEIGNFAKNIKAFSVSDKDNKSLSWQKTASHQWKIKPGKSRQLTVRYRYYADRIEGGSCYVSPDLMYVNPVQCCMYDTAQPDTPCEVIIQVHDSFKCAVPLKETGKNRYACDHFDMLADSPFICSPALKHHTYEAHGRRFHIWIEGICEPDWPRISQDFLDFTYLQVDTMGGFPADEFHFLVHVLPYKFFHGVEHLRSTVLVIGPGEELMTNLYNEFLGVASHELFHVWNVKTIRPEAMQPYDFTQENYSRLGYVYEGITTYYGDLFLARSAFYDRDQYLGCINKRLQRHLDNPGKENYSVAESSFDTWLDGYMPGAPGRKTSIYDEGSLVALMADLMIRHASGSSRSLDDVMRHLYNEYGKTGKGYGEKDLEELVGQAAGKAVDRFFEEVVYRATSYENELRSFMEPAGLQITRKPSDAANEALYGFRLDSGKNIRMVWPGSPAAVTGLMVRDEIVAVNGTGFNDLAAGICTHESTGISLDVKRRGVGWNLKLTPDGNTYFDRSAISVLSDLTRSQVDFLKAWLGS